MSSTFSFWLSLLFVFNFIRNTTTSSLGNVTDNLALLKFKDAISNDPYGILASWNSSSHYCNWHGITCSPMHQRVTGLDLEGYKLHGFISPHVGNLTFLRNLNLANNGFFGNIPRELGQLIRLKQLILSNNSMTGEIPTNLTTCYNLKALFLTGNHLIGKIPIGISSLQKLQKLGISKNNLTGRIPPFIGNLSSLIILAMYSNHLEGDIPQEICSLKNLAKFVIDENRLSGTFHSCLYNMSSLTMISARLNDFNGSLPSNMFNTHLQYIYIGINQFSGTIPISIANASVLQEFDIAQNNLVRQVPSLGKLHDLRWLNLEKNNLGDNSNKDLEFLKSLTNCSKLHIVSISYNNFGGNLPNSIGNLSTQLSQLHLGYNKISGKIPAELGNLIGLILLNTDFNRFEGIIPTTFGKFEKMQLLGLRGNMLSGEIPSIIGNLSQLYYLHIGNNMLEGNIPPSIGNCKKLQYLDLSQNNLRGTIPLEVFHLSSLSNLLNLSKNSLSGKLPREVGRLISINMLDVSENHLSGDIPETIGECIGLEYLYLQGNFFNETIPSSLASLKGLRYLDLSRNHLSGPIPNVMQNITVLEHLNVSFNMLEGEVPTDGVFGNISRLDVIGNNKLCGGISQLHLQPCPVKGLKHAKINKIKLIVVIVSVVSIILMVTIFLAIYLMRKRNQKQYPDSPTIDPLVKVSYQELHERTNGFSASNLVGLGSFGSVYKGNLASEDNVVAIKVLNLQKKEAHKSFIAECNALKNMRHRNLVKILTCCSSTDYKGQEFKALVFEYMNNGSLEQWLHPGIVNSRNQRMLDLDQRLNIAIDIASVLHYLHHECEQLVIHCDLKPSNVLLDDDMVAHVSDFGIARLISVIEDTSHKETSTIGIKGTVGYAPPEYGMGSEISTCGDMYSFGVLLLELLTGKRPTDEMFEEGQNLHMFDLNMNNSH